jgi:hypothetical protein
MRQREVINTQNWKRFSHSDFSLRFLYPDPTPQGSAVEITERSTPDGPLIHLRSEDPDELYFEVIKTHRSAEEGYRQMKEALTRQLGDIDLSPLIQGERSSCRTWETSFRFHDGAKTQERTVVYFEHGETTYRVLFRPHSSLNRAVFETVSFAETP